jgi:hypothetical protein
LDNGVVVGGRHFNSVELAAGEVALERPPLDTSRARRNIAHARTFG